MRLRYKFILIGTIAVFSSFLGYTFAHRVLRPRRPVAEIATRSQRVATSAIGRASATYKISNTGTGELIIGRVRTSCGCSVASISSRSVAPGETATVIVEASSIPAGERDVHIDLETNTTERTIRLNLTLEGYQEPPFVVSSSGPIRFGGVRQHNRSEAILIITRELIGELWIQNAISTIPGLVIEGGLRKESMVGSRVVAREYRYTASFRSLPDPGELVGEVRFVSGRKSSSPCHVLRVHALVVSAAVRG